MRAFGALLTVLAGAASISAAAAPNFDWGLPEGVDPPPVPTDNPMSVIKVELVNVKFCNLFACVGALVARPGHPSMVAVEAVCDASPVFEAAEHALDDVALPVDGLVASRTGSCGSYAAE